MLLGGPFHCQILARHRQQLHQYCPTHHHTPSPIHHCNTPPLFPPFQWTHPPAECSHTKLQSRSMNRTHRLHHQDLYYSALPNPPPPVLSNQREGSSSCRSPNNLVLERHHQVVGFAQWINTYFATRPGFLLDRCWPLPRQDGILALGKLDERYMQILMSLHYHHPCKLQSQLLLLRDQTLSIPYNHSLQNPRTQALRLDKCYHQKKV
mmetsp:Transcript_20505/g.27029  ORF Transcript_20505/g.27029 Transcript_20505/m.27029 type:complete len:208 (-) Transcript_20505:2079-2702(-)